jgi:hypothetical protein
MPHCNIRLVNMYQVPPRGTRTLGMVYLLQKGGTELADEVFMGNQPSECGDHM